MYSLTEDTMRSVSMLISYVLVMLHDLAFLKKSLCSRRRTSIYINILPNEMHLESTQIVLKPTCTMEMSRNALTHHGPRMYITRLTTSHRKKMN